MPVSGVAAQLAGDEWQIAAWQGKELLRAVYQAIGLPAARAALERFYRWSDGVQVPELSRLARTVRAWETELFARWTRPRQATRWTPAIAKPELDDPPRPTTGKEASPAHVVHDEVDRGANVQIEVWSDVVCPWCAIGRARLQRALATFAHRDAVAVRWRSFELDSSAPPAVHGAYVDRLAHKYGTSKDQAQAMIDRVTAQGAAEGLTFRFDLAQPGNTFDAHRLLHLAADRGVQDAVKGRLMTGYLSEGAAIGDPGALARLAAAAGLDASEVTSVLGSDAYADAVRADERQARAFAISGVPFFVIDRRYGIAGAQPTRVLQQVLTQAWSEATA